MEKTTTHKELLEDEWYHVRHSGEIPEVALHSSIHFLTEDKDGPRLTLESDDIQLLHSAAMARYREIIFRDITPEYRDTTMYRGVLRSIANWRRLKRFCQRHDMSLKPINVEVAQLFLAFLEDEVEDVVCGSRSSTINCSFEDIHAFALELGVDLDNLESDLRRICLNF